MFWYYQRLQTLQRPDNLYELKIGYHRASSDSAWQYLWFLKWFCTHKLHLSSRNFHIPCFGLTLVLVFAGGTARLLLVLYLGNLLKVLISFKLKVITYFMLKCFVSTTFWVKRIIIFLTIFIKGEQWIACYLKKSIFF